MHKCLVTQIAINVTEKLTEEFISNCCLFSENNTNNRCYVLMYQHNNMQKILDEGKRLSYRYYSEEGI
jgi:hypothetical protein